MKKSLILLTAFILASSFAAAQTNGINMIGYGTKSVAMGGADVAWINDINALNINPAGLAFADFSQIGIHINAMFPMISHSDFANTLDGESAIYPIPSVGYLHKFKNSPLAIGIGAFAQGGMGAEYLDLNTAFMTSDMTKTQIMHLKGVLGAAVKLSDNFSIGATADFSYSTMQMKFYPDTSYYYTSGFFGMESDTMTATSFGFKVGMMFKPMDCLSIGAAYASKTDFEFDGTMTMNMSAMPGGGLVDFDTVMTGFDWPQQVDFGIAVKLSQNVTVAADITWLNYEDTVREAVMVFTADGFPEIDNTFYFHWTDQWVYAIGIDWALDPGTSIQIGYNYGKNPVPDEYLNPLFPAIVEHHITAGLTMETAGGTEYQFSVSFVPKNEVTYTNTVMPLWGTDAMESMYQFSIGIGVNFPM